MGLKIVLQFVRPEERPATIPVGGLESSDVAIFNEGFLKMAKKVARPDTEITRWYLDKYSGSVAYSYPNRVNDTAIVNKIIQAEEQGYDAVVINCFQDNGLQEAREVVSIPVMGPFESGCLIAQLVGRRFAVVSVGSLYFARFEENLRLYGWEDRAIKNRPFRYFEPWYFEACKECFLGRPEKLIADFEKVALDCVRDGADAIIMGCFPAAAALTLAGYREIGNTGVPFISPAAAAVKMAETMADLRKSTGLVKTESIAGPYRTPPKEMLVQMRKDFGLTSGGKPA